MPVKIILEIIVLIAMGFIANRKGFDWWRWVLAGGIPGFIILLCMPSARAEGIDEETKIKRRNTGNKVGNIISIIAIILVIVVVAVLISLS
jgi:carbon starvation protein CstA